MNHKNNVLTIAGSDSSGGAGIQADIKTFEALNVYSASVITSVTAQNTLGVQQVFDLPDEIIAAQLESVLTDINFTAVKIGMLKKTSYIEIVSEFLKQYSPFVILDPVMISSSGHRLMDEDAISTMTNKLFPLTHLITPNIPEAAKLLDCDTSWIEQNLKEACKQLLTKYNLKAVLLKGGHLSGNICEDTLAQLAICLDEANNAQTESILFNSYKYPKINTKHSHGTGCTLSSAIAANIANGQPLEMATKLAGKFLQYALNSSNLQHVGNGTGPLNHHSAALRATSTGKD